MLRPMEWLRARKRLACAGGLSLCLGGLVISGCVQRATPIALDAPRMPQVAKQPAEQAPDQSANQAQQAAAEKPEGRVRMSRLADAARQAAAAQEQRWARRSEPPQVTSDPFLAEQVRSEAAAAAAQNVAGGGIAVQRPESATQNPTQSVAMPRPQPHEVQSSMAAPHVSGTVLRAEEVSAMDPHGRPLPPVSPAGYQDANVNSHVEQLAAGEIPGGRPRSRLEQLREQLRAQKAAEEQQSQSEARFAIVPDTERGHLLSGPVERPLPNSATPAFVDRIPGAGIVPTAVPADRSLTAPSPAADVAQSREDVALRVQALLAGAEWQAAHGDLRQAYESAILARRLADTHSLSFGQGDRRPEDIARVVWDKLHRQSEGPAHQESATPNPQSTSAAPAASSAPAQESPFPDVPGWKPVPQPRTAAAESTLDEQPRIQSAQSILRENDREGSHAPGPLQASSATLGEERPVLEVASGSPGLTGTATADLTTPFDGSLGRGDIIPAGAVDIRDAVESVTVRRPVLTVPGMTAVPKVANRSADLVGPSLSAVEAAIPGSDSGVAVTNSIDRSPDVETAATVTTGKTGSLWGLAGVFVGVLATAFICKKR